MIKIKILSAFQKAVELLKIKGQYCRPPFSQASAHLLFNHVKCILLPIHPLNSQCVVTSRQITHIQRQTITSLQNADIPVLHHGASGIN